jgi:hypothetical protein
MILIAIVVISLLPTLIGIVKARLGRARRTERPADGDTDADAGTKGEPGADDRTRDND